MIQEKWQGKDRWIVTGSEKTLKRRNIWAFDKPLTKNEQQMENFYSSYSNPEGGEDTQNGPVWRTTPNGDQEK